MELVFPNVCTDVLAIPVDVDVTVQSTPHTVSKLIMSASHIVKEVG